MPAGHSGEMSMPGAARGKGTNTGGTGLRESPVRDVGRLPECEMSTQRPAVSTTQRENSKEWRPHQLDELYCHDHVEERQGRSWGLVNQP